MWLTNGLAKQDNFKAEFVIHQIKNQEKEKKQDCWALDNSYVHHRKWLEFTPWTLLMTSFLKPLRKSVTSFYTWANLVYLCYAIGILSIDYGVDPNDTGYINNLFLGFAIVHLVNACMYALAWYIEGHYPWEVLYIPEYFNMCGAGLYLASAILYRFENTNTYLDKYTFYVHYIETTAASLEVAASFLWVYTWFLTYRRLPGRGWTLDDPDMWANFFIVIPSIVYISYNGQVLHYPPSYSTNFLYQKGDILYFIGSVFYVFAALRDDGWFWVLPVAGQCGVIPIRTDESEEDHKEHSESDKEV